MSNKEGMMNSNYKVRVKNGDFEIEIESTDKNFVESKLKAYSIVNLENDPKSENRKTSTPIANISLSKFLKDNNATVNQNSKFLGAAVYLSTVKGKNFIKTADISTALREAGQTKLNNASLNLSQNLKQGTVEKVSSSEFMVTVEGKERFGISE